MLVNDTNKEAYENYTVTHHKDWLLDSLQFVNKKPRDEQPNITGFSDYIFTFDFATGTKIRETSKGMYLALWQSWPPSENALFANVDISEIPIAYGPVRAAFALGNETTISYAEPHVATPDTLEMQNDFQENVDGTVSTYFSKLGRSDSLFLFR